MIIGNRPLFKDAWAAFMVVRVPVSEVGKKIGGVVQKNTEMTIGGFENACPIRMSYVLNRTGFPISKSHLYATVSGGDGLQYIYRVNDMMAYLERKFGKPDKTAGSPQPADFKGLLGIIVIKGDGWGNSRGHVTLWNGSTCSDSCHLMGDPENGYFVPQTASIWLLR